MGWGEGGEAIGQSEPGPVHLGIYNINLIGMTAIGYVSEIAVFSKIG